MALAVGILVPLQMVSQTWDDHDRSGRYTARDFGFNYLSSVDKDGIIFCNGDNDTFPLWYAQEVEGYRTDVRVINLSYLTTDWYANQQRIPSYDGKPVDMFATPADYAYDSMAWSFIVPRTDSIVTAEDALREMYASTKDYDYHLLTSPNMVMPVDSAAVYRHYGLDTTNAAHSTYLIPYLTDIYTDISRLGKQGLSLGNVLSLDIVANSVKNGFNRPVYFASTVPTSYYMGLTPYMGSTGMALEVTPFATPLVAPTVDKAYENIVGKFRWGGLDALDADDLYLDETVRRMVASTRSGIYSTARDLINSASAPASEWAKEHARAAGEPVPASRGDMGRKLLEILSTKLPASVSPLDGMLGVYMAESYYDLYVYYHNPADLAAAEALLAAEMPRYAQLVRYAQSLTPSQVSLLGASELNALQHLGAAIALQNRIDVLRKLEENPEANSTILQEWRARPTYDNNLRSAPLLYIEGWSSEELEKALEDFSGSTYDVVDYALTALRAHEAAGIEPMALSEKWMKLYDINPQAWNRLLRY